LGAEPRGATAVYSSERPQRIIAPPPLRDAEGRIVATTVIILGAEDEFGTPVPLRPMVDEPTRLVVTAIGASGDVRGCVLALRNDSLEATRAMGSASVGECRQGGVRLGSGDAVSFAVSYRTLPNYRTRDGAWWPGAVLGRAEVRLGLKASMA